MQGRRALFFSTVKANLDAKGRSAMPSEFREAIALAEPVEMQSRLYLVRRELEGIPVHLACFARHMIEELGAELDYCDDARAHVIEGILACADSVRFDTAGRFSIGPESIALLDLTDSLLFVGVGRFYEIWHPDHLAETRSAQVSFHRRALRISAPPETT